MRKINRKKYKNLIERLEDEIDNFAILPIDEKIKIVIHEPDKDEFRIRFKNISEKVDENEYMLCEQDVTNKSNLDVGLYLHNVKEQMKEKAVLSLQQYFTITN